MAAKEKAKAAKHRRSVSPDAAIAVQGVVGGLEEDLNNEELRAIDKEVRVAAVVDIVPGLQDGFDSLLV